jgi:hypothetical protein
MASETSADNGRVHVIFRAPALDVFAWKNVIIFTWRGDATAELLSRVGPVIEARFREVGLMSCINIVQKIFSLPNEEQRQAFKKISDKTVGKYACVVIVLEGTGFFFSAARGLITGLLVVTRQHYTVNIASNVDEVVQWLPEKHATATGVTIDSRELKEALSTARS